MAPSAGLWYFPPFIQALEKDTFDWPKQWYAIAYVDGRAPGRMPGDARRIDIGPEQGIKDDGHHVTQVAEEDSFDWAGQVFQVPRMEEL